MKRGLIDGLGSIIKSVTGNLDSLDAIKYNNDIKILQDDNNKIGHEFNNHVSLCKEWMVQHSIVINKLISNQAKINETLELILDSNAQRDYSLLKYAKFAQYLAIITENVDDVLEEIIRIENTLAFIHASSLHHSMLSTDILNHMIQILVKIYGKEKVLELELRQYYDIIKPGYYYSGDKIVIIFKMPIFSKDSYDLYKLAVAPNKLKQALIPPYPYIATNSNGYVYIEAECPKYSNWYLCGEKMAHQLRQVPDCIQNLITGQYIDKTCEIATVTLSRIAMEELDEKHYVIALPNATRIHTVCGKEDYNVLHGTYLATIPTNCFLYTPEFTITNKNDQIKGQPLKITKLTINEDIEKLTRSHIHLNSIDLRRLHDVQQKITTQPALQLDQVPSSYLYHTTIPLYIVVFGALILAMILFARRYKGKKRSVGISPPANKIYEKPEDSGNHRSQSSLFSQLKLQK